MCYFRSKSGRKDTGYGTAGSSYEDKRKRDKKRDKRKSRNEDDESEKSKKCKRSRDSSHGEDEETK